MIPLSSLCFYPKSTPILGRYEDSRGISVSISACLVYVRDLSHVSPELLSKS